MQLKQKNRVLHFIKENWMLIAGIIAAILFVYSNFFFGDYQLSFTNLMYQVLPWSTESVATEGPTMSDVVDSAIPSLYTTITNGTPATFWDSNVALGTSVDVSSWLYPLNYLYLLPLGAAEFLRSASEFFIAFIGMFLLMKSFGCQKGAAIITGTAYCFSSVIVLWLGWQHSDVAAFAPLVFFFFERFLSSLKIKYCFGLATVVYLMIVAGMPTYAAYFLYLLAAYVLFRTIWIYRHEKKRILIVFAGTIVAVFVAVLCSLPYTMSLLSSLSGNGYMDSRLSQATATLSFKYLFSLFFPYLRLCERFGESATFSESTIYVGLITIVMLFFTPLRFFKKKRMVFWCAALATVFLLIFTHKLDFIYIHLPLINTSLKFRIITLFNFIAVIIMGLNLNDLLVQREEYINHKVRSFVALGAGTALLAALFLLTHAYIYGEGNTDTYVCYLIVALLMFVGIGGLLFKKVSVRGMVILLGCVVLFDMGSFAKEYLPWIEKGSSVIPEATDTIEFLQENTTDERIGAVGTWALFANTNVFYDLNDVRGHNFVFTNEDMASYYQAISSDNATSSTRYDLEGKLNTNLLQYLGMKYLVKGIEYTGTYDVPGEISCETTVYQEYTFEDDYPTAIVIFAATYGVEFEGEEKLLLTITETDSGEIVYEGEYDLSAMKDNSSFVMRLGENDLRADISYTLSFTTNTDSDHPITFWLETEDVLPSEVYYDGTATDMDLSIDVIYEAAYIGEDSLYVYEFEDYTDRVELADTVTVLEDEEAVLNQMSKAYAKNTAFLTEEEAEKLSGNDIGELAASDMAEITERTANTVTIQVTAETTKLLMLNEYFTDDWKVYVNGEEQEVIQSNYLFRAVEVPAGESTVEFRYEPKTLIRMFYVALAGVIFCALLIIFHRKIQCRTDCWIAGDGVKNDYKG